MAAYTNGEFFFSFVVAKGDENMKIFTLVAGEGGGGGDGDSFNSVTCFCGKPFAGRPMIECSGCLTWLHMSCAKVKRKNIPEFYYCDNCKSNGMLSPTAMMLNNTSSGEETTTLSPTSLNGTSTLSSNSIIDGVLANTNMAVATAKPRKPKSIKKMMMNSSSDNIKNYASDSKKPSVNGKLKKSTKKIRQSPTKVTKAYASSSLAAAASLTELSLNHQVSNGGSENLLKSPIATNNNIYESPAIDTENGGSGDLEKFNNKRLKTL
jgi:PHD-finger